MVNLEVDWTVFVPISNLANQVSGKTQSFLVVCWSFDEGTSSSVDETCLQKMLFLCHIKASGRLMFVAAYVESDGDAV